MDLSRAINKSIIYIWDNSIVVCEISDRPFENRVKRLTEWTIQPPSNLVWSKDGKTMAFNRALPEGDKLNQKQQIFVIKL